MLFPSIDSLHRDNWEKSTNFFLVLLVLVLAYLVFIHMTSTHILISVLVVFIVQYFTFITFSSIYPFTVSAAIFSLATHRFDYSFFVSLLLHSAASIHLPFLEATSPIIFPQFFHSSLITCTSVLQHV